MRITRITSNGEGNIARTHGKRRPGGAGIKLHQGAQMATKKQGSGWLKISEPVELEKALVRMLNKILMSDDPVSHAGKFAGLATAWIAARKLRLDVEEIKDLQAKVAALEARK